MKRFLTFALVAMLASITITAQTTRTTSTKKTKANVTGFIKDSENAEVLVRATIQVMTEDTTKMVAGGVTNTMGGFTIKSVEEGTYIVKVSYLGYHNFFRKVTIKNGETIHNVGTVLLTPNSVLLTAAVVTGELPQMEVKEDTIIFNADAFKVPEGSVLEDLVKKLPGAEVDNEGGIKINGKTISKILVNGKEFFSNDRNMAMKNIPTEIVDKIKTYDKASDNERLTGIADGQEETVIDLTLKKGMNRGMFGNVNLGAGTAEQLQSRFTLQRFVDDTFQMSLIGNGNSSKTNGLSRSGQIGLNAVASQRDKYEIGGNIRYNTNIRENESRSASENYVRAVTTFSDRVNSSRNHSDNGNGDMKIEVKLDSATTLLVRPTFGFGGSASKSSGENATYNANPYDFDEITNPLRQWDELTILMGNQFVNKNLSASRTFSNNKSASANWTLNRRFYNKQGRNFSLNGNIGFNNSDSKNFNASNVTYYRLDSIAPIYRYRTTPNRSKNFSIGFTYSEPIARNLILQTSYNYSYSHRKNNSDTYDLVQRGTGITPNYETLGDSILNILGYLPDWFYANEQLYRSSDLSNYNTNVDGNHNINLQLRWNNNFITSSIGVQMRPQHQHLQMKYMGEDVDTTRNFFQVSPTLDFRYRINRQNQLNFSYRGSMSQPSITDMIEMTDDSNPLNIRHGNPELKNSFQNTFSFNWNNYITATMQTLNARLSFSNTMNRISSKTQYDDDDGHAETTPMNINGNWNASANFGFNTPLFANERFMLNTSVSGNYSNNMSYLALKETDENGNTIFVTPDGGTTINRFEAKIGMNGQPVAKYRDVKNQTNNLGINGNVSVSYRWDNWDIRAYGNFNFNHQDNKYIDVTSPDTYNFGYGFSTTGNFDNGWGYSTDFGMSSRRGYASREANTNEAIWNAQVSYRFLKGRSATISLRWNDILNQRSNFNRNVSANGRTDTWTTSTTSYVMATFIYRFRLFGTASQRREVRQERQERETYRANMERENAAQGIQQGPGQQAGGRNGGGNMGAGGMGGNRGGGNMGAGGRF